MARASKLADWYQSHEAIGREATIRAQLDIIKILTGDYVEKIKRTTAYDPAQGLGLRGVAVEWARIGWGLKWSEERVDLGYRFIFGLQELGILQIVDDPKLPNATGNLFKKLILNQDALPNADTRIKTQP